MSYKEQRKIYISMVCVMSLMVFGVVNGWFQAGREHKSSYHFVITDISVTPTKSLVFYDGDDRVQLWNFTVSERQNVKVGDSLSKPACSDTLFIYRKDVNGVYQKIIANRANIFAGDFFCD